MLFGVWCLVRVVRCCVVVVCLVLFVVCCLLFVVWCFCRAGVWCSVCVLLVVSLVVVRCSLGVVC